MRHLSELIAITLLAGTFAKADVTYTYTGNPFTGFDGSYVCEAGVGECSLSGSFTLAALLPANLNEPLSGDGYTFTPLSFRFTDGVNVLNQSNAPCGYACTGPEFEVFDTNAKGIPTVWNVDVGTGGFIPRYQMQTVNEVVNTSCCVQDISLQYEANGAYNAAFVGADGVAPDTGNPGTWAVSRTSPVPEPSTISYLFLLLGIAGIALKRSRKHRLL
jgi:hypothetical protein